MGALCDRKSKLKLSDSRFLGFLRAESESRLSFESALHYTFCCESRPISGVFKEQRESQRCIEPAHRGVMVLRIDHGMNLADPEDKAGKSRWLSPARIATISRPLSQGYRREHYRLDSPIPGMSQITY